MAMSTDIDPSGDRHFRLSVRAVAIIGVLTLLAVVLLMTLDTVQVQTRQELDHVAFGLPLSWITQSQGLNPPLPYRTGMVSPWENPTTVQWLRLVVDVFIVGLVLTGVWRGMWPLHARRSAN